jgi:hypothetical protein
MPLFLLFLGVGAIAYFASKKPASASSAASSIKGWSILLQGPTIIPRTDAATEETLLALGIPPSSVLDAAIQHPPNQAGTSVLSVATAWPMPAVGRQIMVQGVSFSVTSIQPVPIDIQRRLKEVGLA